jgi:serine/threonine-protein kinase
MRRHVEQDVPPPSAEVPDVPPDVDDLVLAATARDPQHRYADAGAFLSAVRAARSRLGTPAGDTGHLEVAAAAGVLVAAAVTGPAATASAAPAGAVARTADTGPLHHTTTTLEPPVDVPWRPSADEVPPGSSPPPSPLLLVDGPDDPFAAPPPTRRRRARRLLLLALLAAVVAGLWWWVDGRMVPAPALVGMTVEQAQATAQAAGLQAQQAGEEYSETVPAGAVSSTDPVAGAKIAPGDTIALVVSRGPERYAVPDLTGQSQEQAGQSLAALTLVPGTVGEAYDDQVPAGQVVSQDPAAGTEVTRASSVSFVVSLGRQPIGVPSVVGQARDDAVAAVQDAGLVAEVTEQYSADVDRGLVISQEPGEGTLFRGDAVALVVSLGPETVPVPSVEGMGAGEARAALEQAGFTVRRVELLPAGPNQVLRQAPTGGQSARVGSEVTIYVF